VTDRFIVASAGFERVLRKVGPSQWTWPTPCAEWNVRQLVNHMTRGNLNYVMLLTDGNKADFLRLRDVDALGTDPVGAFVRSAEDCAAAFSGALQQILDYPLGRIPGWQALAVRMTDSVIHTWDLATAIGVDPTLDPGLVAWITDHVKEIYAGLAESPIAAGTTHRFFAAPTGSRGASRQDRLLHLMGRTVS
jgi:uncharacterized protein (TIGR03086 family)